MPRQVYDIVVPASTVADRFGGKKSGRGYRFACPVHNGESQTSFEVYNDTDGKLRFRCWSRRCGEDDVKVVYAALGLELIDGSEEPDYRRNVLHCVVDDRMLTVSALKDLPTWIAQHDKRPVGFNFKGMRYQWQATIPEGEGGLAVARFGGIQVKDGGDAWKVPEWSSGYDVVERLKAVGQPGQPALAQSGSVEQPCPHNVGVLDIDYNPDKDVRYIGLQMRDEYRKRCLVLGLPTFHSRSLNGYHALFRTPVSGDWLDRPVAWPRKGDLHGLRVEVFPAGRRGAVALQLARQINEADHIPAIPAAGIESVVKTKRWGEHDYIRDEACPCLPVHCVVCAGPKEVGVHGWRCGQCAHDFLQERYPKRYITGGWGKVVGAEEAQYRELMEEGE